MAEITFKGKQVTTSGTLPAVGTKAPEFKLTRASLADATLAEFAGKKKVLNIVPSLDTGVCAASARRFDQALNDLGDTVVLTISRDLPFAQKRFCSAEGLERIVTLSELRNRDFGKAYGAEQLDGPLAGLLARAVVVLDANDKVVYTQQVPEITSEPDYDAALAAVKKA
jgi:thiol peroxidase